MQTEIELFNNYIKEFEQMDIDIKRKEVIDSIMELFTLFGSLCANNDIKVNLLNENELLSKNINFKSEDEFLKTILIYVENTKNIIAEYMHKFIN